MSISSRSAPLIAPSILSADFSRLGADVAEVEKGGADWIHVDVMDGHFVPNLTIGPLVAAALKPITKLPLDCHLMVTKPEDWVDGFAKAGAASITVHAEATVHLDRLLHQIRDHGCKAGVSLNPGSPLALIEEVLDLVDVVLIMSVNPGFGGQKFIESTLSKVERLAKLRAQGGYKFVIQIDGGINEQTIGRAYRAGVDCFVAGNAIFSQKDRAKAIASLKAAAL
jgi:ribulose-phosphate 3-epimerase